MQLKPLRTQSPDKSHMSSLLHTPTPNEPELMRFLPDQLNSSLNTFSSDHHDSIGRVHTLISIDDLFPHKATTNSSTYVNNLGHSSTFDSLNALNQSTCGTQFV